MPSPGRRISVGNRSTPRVTVAPKRSFGSLIGTALTRPPLPYVKFKVLHRFGSQRGISPIASWSGELEWTGVGCRRTLRLEVNQGDGMFRWYWSAGDDHQSEQALAIESVSEDLIKSIIASIADEETFDAGRVPLVTVAPTNGCR